MKMRWPLCLPVISLVAQGCGTFQLRFGMLSSMNPVGDQHQLTVYVAFIHDENKIAAMQMELGDDRTGAVLTVPGAMDSIWKQPGFVIPNLNVALRDVKGHSCLLIPAEVPASPTLLPSQYTWKSVGDLVAAMTELQPFRRFKSPEDVVQALLIQYSHVREELHDVVRRYVNAQWFQLTIGVPYRLRGLRPLYLLLDLERVGSISMTFLDHGHDNGLQLTLFNNDLLSLDWSRVTQPDQEPSHHHQNLYALGTHSDDWQPAPLVISPDRRRVPVEQQWDSQLRFQEYVSWQLSRFGSPAESATQIWNDLWEQRGFEVKNFELYALARHIYPQGMVPIYFSRDCFPSREGILEPRACVVYRHGSDPLARLFPMYPKLAKDPSNEVEEVSLFMPIPRPVNLKVRLVCYTHLDTKMASKILESILDHNGEAFKSLSKENSCTLLVRQLLDNICLHGQQALSRPLRRNVEDFRC